jgi:4-hydroxy-tetrahydrodipicolinate reductase
LKCFEAGVPVIAGTTGWLEQLPEIRERCARGEGTLLYASNFSVGVNIFFEINRRLAALMDMQPQYEVSIHEVHHTEKLDAPSGTAITLGNDIIAASNAKSRWVNHASEAADELPIFSYREPGVPGTHTIKYESPDDSIEITHKANSRKGFAQGAVLAAEWIVGRKGFFEMKDFLSL